MTAGDVADWGTTADGGQWTDAGSEGGTAGIDGEAFYVEGEGGQGITTHVSEDIVSPAWADGRWGARFTFTASDLVRRRQHRP